ncbi:MAG TPA: RNA polymerase sigma factor [Candidatus Wallbacteria bacterium]|nr:RNA polymerase sigma factor [Candidatus Wallbacteria bacterium]
MQIQTVKNENIINAYRDGNRKGFEALYDAYYKDVFYFTLNLSGDAHGSLDITQTVFMKAFNEFNKKSVSDISNIKAWLFKIAVNEFYQIRRSYVTRIKYMVENLFRFIDRESEVHVEFIEKKILEEEKKDLGKWLLQIEEKDRAILILRYYDELSYAEISAILEIEEGTVMSRLFRAKEKLRRLMDDESK